MVDFKANISDPKTGKSYQLLISGQKANPILGKKIGDKMDGIFVEMPGYKLEITGGSDKDGFPMKQSLGGQARKKLLMRKGIGIRSKRKGEKRRKRVRGQIVGQDIHQLNLKVTEYGTTKLSDAFKKVAAAKEPEEKKTAKQRALDQARFNAVEVHAHIALAVEVAEGGAKLVGGHGHGWSAL